MTKIPAANLDIRAELDILIVDGRAFRDRRLCELRSGTTGHKRGRR